MVLCLGADHCPHGQAYLQQPLQFRQIKNRRRIAGDYDGLLHESLAGLEKARQAKNVPAQVDALTSLAVTYAYANATRQQITLLEEAMTLEKSMLPPGGIPENATAQRYYFRALERLGAALANNKEIGKARQCFDEVTKGIDGISNAAAKARLASIYGDALLGKAYLAELDDDPDTARDLLQKALPLRVRPSPESGPAVLAPLDIAVLKKLEALVNIIQNVVH